jgi:cobalt/nickel transport system ATP-binding protein
MNKHLIEATNLSYNYPDGTPALQGVSLQIRPGETIALIGANGAGKSTLLLHLNGCLLPLQGNLQISDLPVTKKNLAAIRRAVGLVFQNPDDQLFMPTVSDDVAFGPLNLGLALPEVEVRVTEALAQVGLTHLRHKPPYRLSGGEKRLAAIATVLAMHPDILVLDEPSSNLDPRSRRNLINLLHTLPHTKIIATHDLDLVLDLCPRVLILHQGRIIADGAPSDLLQNDELLERSHLEKPLRLALYPVPV